MSRLAQAGRAPFRGVALRPLSGWALWSRRHPPSKVIQNVPQAPLRGAERRTPGACGLIPGAATPALPTGGPA